MWWIMWRGNNLLLGVNRRKMDNRKIYSLGVIELLTTLCRLGRPSGPEIGSFAPHNSNITS
jgi:hypothetical protein